MSETVTAPAPAAPPAPVETFSKEYVRELREENKGWRLKVSELEQSAKAIKDDLGKAAAEAEAKIAEANRTAAERIIRAEIKAAALRAGMIDLDGLKMLDLSAVKLTETGEIEGADALLEAAKKAKPYLFGDAKTASTAPTPAATPPKTKTAGDMSPEEYKAARERIRRGLPLT
ncbi:MAG: hypothetical protein B7Z74_01870 [Deltaproteobacteria bacterium 21-66-5]|nr:MAG: hypothetical protein B7Z74_01870 [Deltaproteobacteria bacterium 21-66-5]